jgi:hypothetical protein
MNSPSGSTTRRHARARRLLALFVFGWLNLIIQPCVAEMPVPPAGMEHCDHGGSPDHATPCPAMQAADCETSAAWNAGAAQPSALPRTAVALAWLPIGQTSSLATADPRAATSGPPLTIRFCTLRN